MCRVFFSCFCVVEAPEIILKLNKSSPLVKVVQCSLADGALLPFLHLCSAVDPGPDACLAESVSTAQRHQVSEILERVQAHRTLLIRPSWLKCIHINELSFIHHSIHPFIIHNSIHPFNDLSSIHLNLKCVNWGPTQTPPHQFKDLQIVSLP